MIEVELPDGTIVEFPAGTSAEVMQQALAGYSSAPAPSSDIYGNANKDQFPQGVAGSSGVDFLDPVQGDPTGVTPIVDNVVGLDNGVDTAGEKLGSLIRGGGAATARGIADVPAIPANLAQLGAMGVEKLTGMDNPSMVSRALDKLPDTRGILSSITGGESDYRAPGTAGDFVATGGEFAGGAGAMKAISGGKNVLDAMVRYGLVPGFSSEGAGKLTEGTAAEPYARTAAALATSMLASPKPGAFKGGSENAKMANTLKDGGVKGVTAGQAKGSQALMRLEGRLSPTGSQLDDYTRSVMRKIGSADDVATPSALLKAERAIVGQMDDAVKGIDIIPSKSIAKDVMKVAAKYKERVPAAQLTPRIRGIANEITAISKSKKTVSLKRLKQWRSDIGKYSVSPEQATRDAAHKLRGYIDEMTDTSLTAAGRESDIASLAKGREMYRDFISVRDAASRAGAEGGKLSPTQLNQSVIRAQGRNNYATGRTTDMADFTRAGAAVLRPAPTVNPGGTRTLSEALPGALGAAGAAAGYGAGFGPAGMAAAGVGAATLPFAGQRMMRSNMLQSLARDPASVIARQKNVMPGILSGLFND